MNTPRQQFRHSDPRKTNTVSSIFWLQSPADQQASIQRMARQRMSAATIASIVKMSAAEVSRILEAHP